MNIDYPSAVWLRDERTSLLNMASDFTINPDVPEAVRDNAARLQEWVESANSLDDRKNRLAALRQASSNRLWKRERDNKPELLIAEAETYYAFLKAA